MSTTTSPIPVREVRAEGRALAVELTAPAGTTPVVYRVRGVSAVAATAFADAITARLPEEGDRVPDGTSLVTEGVTTESERETTVRRLKFAAWVVGLALVGTPVTMGITGSVISALLFLLWTPFSWGVLVCGLWLMRMPYDEWRLPRYGITVEARRNGRRSYDYTDLHGQVRGAAVGGTAPTIMVAYAPDDLGPVVRVVGLVLVSLDVFFAVDGFQGGLF
ncbi:hypothetical protein [Streptomyces sp. NPDC056144]|uniref:hypothetical protein n=1 Tax=unclassified Streptomyces TaxID=2593676 RepID=UPI0035D9ADFA